MIYAYAYRYIAVGRPIFFFLSLFFKEEYVLWEKPYIPHVIIEYDLYLLLLVISQV